MTVDPNFAENHCPRMHLESYKGRWPSQFDEEADRLRPAIGPTLLAIEHVGSTAVPGLAAKPIIGHPGGRQQLGRLRANGRRPRGDRLRLHPAF